MSDSVRENYYNSDYFPSVERAVLMEDILFKQYADLVGKFRIPVMTPQAEKSEAKSTLKPQPSSRDRRGTGSSMSTNTYTNTNFVNLTIPAYIAISFAHPKIETINFTEETPGCTCDGKSGHLVKTLFTLSPDKNGWFKIPKGTQFLITFLGGELKYDMLRIIGVYTRSDALPFLETNNRAANISNTTQNSVDAGFNIANTGGGN